MRIVEELVEIWLNEVCDRKTRKKLEKIERQMAREEENDGNDQGKRKNQAREIGSKKIDRRR